MPRKRSRTYLLKHEEDAWRIYSDGTRLSTFAKDYFTALGIAERKAETDVALGFKAEVRSAMPDGTARLDWPKKAAKKAAKKRKRLTGNPARDR